jgi:hypothetical protein
MSAVPGATVGNAVTSGFAAHGATNIAPDIKKFIEDPSVQGGIDVGIDALEMAPLIGPTYNALSSGARATVNTIGKAPQATKNYIASRALSNQLDATPLSVSKPTSVRPKKIDLINQSTVGVKNDFTAAMSEAEYNQFLEDIYLTHKEAFDNPMVEHKGWTRPSSYFDNVGNNTGEYAHLTPTERSDMGKFFKDKFCPPGSECAKSANAVSNRIYTDLTGKPFAVNENAHNAWHLEDQMTRHGGQVVDDMSSMKVGDRVLMGNEFNQSTEVPGYVADPSVRHAATYAGLGEVEGQYVPMVLESGKYNPMHLNPINYTFTGPNSVKKIIRPGQFVGDETGKALVDKNFRYAYRDAPATSEFSSQNETAQKLIDDADYYREWLKKSHDITNDEFNELVNNVIGVGAQETKLNGLLPGSKLSKAKIALQDKLNEAGLTKPIKEVMNAGKRVLNLRLPQDPNLPKYPGASQIEMEAAKLSANGDMSLKEAVEMVKTQYQKKPRFTLSNTDPSNGPFRQKYQTKTDQLAGMGEDLKKQDAFPNAIGQMAENYKKAQNLYPDASPRELMDITTLMWNSPGKASNKKLVDFYLFGKDNPDPSKFNFDYLRKVNNVKDELINVHPKGKRDPYYEYFRNGEYPEIQYRDGGLHKYQNGGLPKYQVAGVFDPTPKGNTTSVNNLGFLPDNYLEDIIAKDLLIQENNKLASQWATNHPNNVVQRPINNDKVDYPSTDRRSSNYAGNPNWAFAAPNMTGKQRADAEAYHGDIIGGELLGTAAFKGLTELQKLRFTTDPNKYYRAVGSDAAEDFINNGVVRSKVANPENTNVVSKGTINLQNRPTAFPSFSKGEISKEYVKGIPDHYVIETDRAMKASTMGRHGKGSTIFPVDESGNYLKEFPASEARLLKPHWLGYKEVPTSKLQNGGVLNYQNGGEVVTDYDKNWDYKKENGVVYTKRKDAEKWMSPKVGSAAELAIQSNVFGSPSELEKAVQMPIPESPNLNVAPPQDIGDTIQSVAPQPMDMAPTAPTERMLPEMSMPDISMPDIDMPDLSLSEKLLQAQGMLGSLWEGAKDVGGDIMDDVASAGSTVSSFLQDRVEDINEEVTDAIKFKKEAEETVAAKSQQISNYLSDIFTPDSEKAEPISPEQAPAKKSRTEAFAEMLRGSVPDMPDVALPKMQMPDVSVPNLPDMPDLPNVSMPDIEAPKVSLPDMPDISMPDMPDVGAFTGYAKEVISNAVESGQSSLADLKTFFKEELVDYAKNFAERAEGIEESVHSVIDAAKDLPGLLASISSVEKEIGSVEPDLVLSPEDANPKETFEEMLIRGANSLQSGHILAGDVMYRVENGELTKKMETIIGKNTALHKGAVAQLSYGTTLKKNWYNGDGSLRKFETEEGLKTGPEIKEEGLWEKYGGGATAAGIYEFTHQPVKGYEKYPGYNSYLKALPGTPTNFVTTKYRGEDGKLNALGSYMGYHQFPNKLKEIRAHALKKLDISNELSAGCVQNSECDNIDMGILLQSNPSMADSLIILNANMGPLSAAAIENFAKSFDKAKTKKEQGQILQRMQALATFN